MLNSIIAGLARGTVGFALANQTAGGLGVIAKGIGNELYGDNVPLEMVIAATAIITPFVIFAFIMGVTMVVISEKYLESKKGK